MSATDDKDNVVPFDPTKRRPKKSDDGDGPRNIDDFLRTLKMVRDPSGRIFGVFGPELIPADTQKFLDRISWDYHQRTRKVTSRQQIEKALAVVRGNPEIRSSVVPCRYGYDSAGAIWLDGVTHAVKIDERGGERPRGGAVRVLSTGGGSTTSAANNTEDGRRVHGESKSPLVAPPT